MQNMAGLESFIRDIPDFPKKGILFKDITPLLRDAGALAQTIEALAEHHRGDRIDAVAAVESRGFIFGCALALELKAGFIPMRKPGKLPYRTVSESYSLEYGADSIHVHDDAIQKGDRILVVDDLLATGGTSSAAINLVARLGGEVVGASFIIELSFLGGRARLGSVPVFALINYE
ncbi:MAG TPA: adenine phosphoribosyltransferase [Patescibacteria group bacterium]|nr:adenine phosphoribosyltransferase [Patescibacteria group bacterium]